MSFTGPLLDPYGNPSQEMARLVDSIFFYLDSVFVPQRAGSLSGPKLHEFFRVIGTPEDRNPGRLPPLVLVAYYKALGIPYESVQQGPETIPVIGRLSFLNLFVLYAKRDPDLVYHQLNRPIQMFQLRDPMPPHNLWQSLPREYLSMQSDPNVVAMFNDMKQRYADRKKQDQQNQQMVARKKIELQHHKAQLMAGLMRNGAQNIQEASLPPGWTYRKT